ARLWDRGDRVGGRPPPRRADDLGDPALARPPLVRHEPGLDAEWQIRRDLRHRPLDVLAQGENISAFAHGDGEADGRLAIDAEQRLRGIGIAASDLRDVAEAEHPPADDEVHAQYILLGLERTRHTQRQRLVTGLDRAGRLDDVLRLQRGDQSRAIDAQAGELLHRELDEDLLVLRPEDLDLRNVLHL